MSRIASRRGVLVVAIAAALAAGAIAATTSAARGARPHRWGAGTSTVHVIEHAITDTEYPSVTGKDAPGNELIFTNPVFNVGNTTQVGHDEGFCTRLNPTTGSWECLWTTFLKGGQITVQGPYYDTANSVLSITGGTGAYRNSRGQMLLDSRDNGTEYDFIFQLS
jgi:allene oxide cyclase